MPRRYDLTKKRSGPIQDEVRIHKTREITGRRSRGSVFSCVTNISDAGTYEIEICEGQSPECGSVSNRPLSCNTSLTSNNSEPLQIEKCLKSRFYLGFAEPEREMPPFKSETEPVQSYYLRPSTVNHLGSRTKSDNSTRVEYSDKEINAVVHTVDRAQSCADSSSESSLAHKKEDCKSSATSGSENSCSCSDCDSGTSSYRSTNSSDENGPSDKNTNLSSRWSRSHGSSTRSCRTPKSEEPPKEISANGSNEIQKESLLNEGSMEEVKSGKTTIVLELIREEKEKESLKIGDDSKACKCDIKNYDERLKKLENFYISSRAAEDIHKKNGECVHGSHPSCGCTAAIINFAEIKFRIDALEKLYKDSLEKKDLAQEETRKSTKLEAAILETEEEREKEGIGILPEKLDEAIRTAVELAKIKKRLVDLERKIIKHKVNGHNSIQRQQRGVATHPNQQLDKEIQVIDLENEQGLKPKALNKEIWGYGSADKTAECYFTNMTKPWESITSKDESIQTPSKKSIYEWGGDSEFPMKAESTKKRFVCTRSCDKMHVCKECHYYLTEKFEEPFRKTNLEENVRGNERPWKAPEENNGKFMVENFNKIGKSFGMYSINESDYLAPRKSCLRQTKRIHHKKEKRDFKNLKLCSKCPRTNLQEMLASGYESEMECEEEYQSLVTSKNFDKKCDSIKYVSLRSKKSEKYMENMEKLPHQSFHIYRCEERRHSLFFPSHLKHNSSRRKIKVSPPDDTIPKINHPYKIRDENSQLHDDYHHPSSVAERLESREKNESCVSAMARGQGHLVKRDPHLKKTNAFNPFHSIKTGKNTKIPPLFEEMCNSRHMKARNHRSGLSANMLRAGVEAGKNALNPWKKILRKLSHSQAMDTKAECSPIREMR